MRLYLIDGTYELFRAFFAVPSSQNEQGAEVGAVRGLARSMFALLRNEPASHVAVAFDHVIESFRNRLFDGYKTGEGLPFELTSQFELAERATRALGMVTWPMVEFEADDAIATAAARFHDDVSLERIVICSPDKDLTQCVRGDRIVTNDRQRGVTLDEAGVNAKFGVPPRSIPDYLALVGDTADGIPGVPRWGARSAATVLSRYGHLESIPARARDWDVKVRGADALASGLSAMTEEAKLYRTLATLREDVPLEESLADLEWRGVKQPEFDDLCRELADPTLAERIPR
jgi:5'-3' exonuclease